MPKSPTGKNKETLRKWAIKNHRKILWLDDKGIWHAATNENNVPYPHERLGCKIPCKKHFHSVKTELV